MSKLYFTDKHVKSWVHSIVRDINNQQWRPDYIVGLNRGGLTPAVMISHYLDVPMHTLDVSFRDSDNGPESNLWMAEDAFGYPTFDPLVSDNGRKNILIVDDINDSGRTLDWIKQDWPSGCKPNDPRWNEVWNNNVRFAVLINNEASNFKDVDYVGKTINKHETPVWVVFPWEAWWEQ